MKDLPVVAVVATHGFDRIALLLDRALPSISRQTHAVDLVVVVSDDDVLMQDDSVDIKEKFKLELRDRVRLVPNARTRHTSGTGSWNTGIMAAYSNYKDCWVAILDDDDEWHENHISKCLEAAAAATECQWVASGIIRQGKSGVTHEPILMELPHANQFFVANPGVQGSNLFVRVGLLLRGGMFDESLPSTTDRDLCIRLCDVLEGKKYMFASTCQHTVVHHADTDRHRVSTPGSPAKIQGLVRFFFKHGARMTDDERKAFKTRASELFGCDSSEFNAIDGTKMTTQPFQTWSRESLPLSTGTADMLPTLDPHNTGSTKQNALIGVTTGDINRIKPLLDDIAAASMSSDCNFAPFVIVLVNSSTAETNQAIEDALKSELAERDLRGFLLTRTSSSVVDSILRQCLDGDTASSTCKLPIALSRTVLQVFIHHIVYYLEDVRAVVILDDDKRLPRNWSPFIVTDNGGDLDAEKIYIGRDLRTPPNPSIFSLRTNLLDLIHQLDLTYSSGKASHEMKRFCYSYEAISDKHDWYYDLSTARYDHLEMPVLRKRDDIPDMVSFLRLQHDAFLRGTPFCRDVVPPAVSGDTEQRGGCMVLLNKSDRSFLPLAVQQDAPRIKHHDTTINHTRRSDSFWCKFHKDRGCKVKVNEKLYVYHDNQFDVIADPQGIRKTVVEEVLGGILCRGARFRENYKNDRLVELRAWYLRIKGLLTTLLNRPYATDAFIAAFVAPLEDIFIDKRWETEVFAVIEREYLSIKDFYPTPVDFSSHHLETGNTIIQINENIVKELVQEWDKTRVNAAADFLYSAIGSRGIFIGLGNEGISFAAAGLLYKVFDRASGVSLPALEKSNASLVKCAGPALIVKRPFYHGKLYRGGHGKALVQLLQDLQKKNLYHSNITPDNLLLDHQDTSILRILDLGRDFHIEEDDSIYEPHFQDMCKRAFLCFRFGGYAGNSFTLKKLKEIMRAPSPEHLVGFDNFMSVVTRPDSTPEGRLLDKLNEIGAVCCGIVSCSTSTHLPVILPDHDDKLVVNLLQEAIASKIDECKSQPIAIAIDNPFADVALRRPIWFYKRHILRLLRNVNASYTLEELSITAIDGTSFEEYTKYIIFLLVSNNPGCYLLIKSCPMEHKVILSNVKRIIHTLEGAGLSFKSIMLIADVSKIDNFIRQYESGDMESYNDALRQIQEERLVDEVLVFDGKDSSCLAELNLKWFGQRSLFTHSSEGQHYASSLFAFEAVHDYNSSDLLLQLDSDIILHCEDYLNGLAECAAEFRKEPDLITFGFPILTEVTGGPASRQYMTERRAPPRMEIRCSFLHLKRLFDMLPLAVPYHELSASSDTFCIRRGWWHILDHNIRARGKKSCRGSLAGNRWFFIHPQNEVKDSKSLNDLNLVSDVVSSNLYTTSELEHFAAYHAQRGKVDLQTVNGCDWFPKVNVATVVVFNLHNTSERDATASFQSLLAHTQNNPDFSEDYSVVVLDNGSYNYEDISSRIFERASDIFGAQNLLAYRCRSQLSDEQLESFLSRICSNARTKILIARPTMEFKQLILPLDFCHGCEALFDGPVCQCCRDQAEFTGVPSTNLPIAIPPFGAASSTCYHPTTFYATDKISEGSLTIELAVCVKGNADIKDAEHVLVRVHSECLTGDVFYSRKCDCGEQKLKFMHMMAEEKNAVLVYIKGHEGRGNGLCNKTKAYYRRESGESKNHVDALHDLGCKSDIREYGAAFTFLKKKLQIKSLKLYSNNPEKIEAAKNVFGSRNVIACPMPADAEQHNETYLQEKVELCGHDARLIGNSAS